MTCGSQIAGYQIVLIAQQLRALPGSSNHHVAGHGVDPSSFGGDAMPLAILRLTD